MGVSDRGTNQYGRTVFQDVALEGCIDRKLVSLSRRPHPMSRQVSPTPQHVCGPPEPTKRALARCLTYVLVPATRGKPVHPLPGERQE